MSQSNGPNTSAITNNKINLNGSNSDSESVATICHHLQRLVPEIKQNCILISQQFTEFLTYTESLNKLYGSMQLKQDELEQELEQLRKDSKQTVKKSESSADGRVFLDVGGHHFTTKVGTLIQSSNSIFFKSLIAEEWTKDTNTADNRIFIDRDGRLFDYVLKYLRTGELNVDDKTLRKELLTEAKYYKVQSLEDELSSAPRKEESLMALNPLNTTSQSPPCSPTPGISRTRSSPYAPSPTSGNLIRTTIFNQSMPTKSKLHPAQTASSWRAPVSSESRLNIFQGSTLLTLEYEEKLLEFIGANPQPQQPWRLIYRASEHGFDAADFHHYCDSHAPTISVIQTDFGNLFGGFTSVAWSSATLRADQTDPTAFLFTLKNTLSIPATKFPVAKEFEQRAISHNPTCGPNFGSPKNEGSDLCLRNKFNEKTNCIFFPKSYVDTTNQGGIIFAKRYFACKEVEVFTLTVDV